MEPDYYKVLGVAPDSEDIVIQAAYRALMRRYHPDKNSSADAARKAKEINAAYAVLSDPSQRSAYDARRSAAKQKQSYSSNSATPPPPPPKRDSEAATPAETGGEPEGRRYGGIIFASALTALIVASLAISGMSSTSSSALNAMNVDENLTTTDMNATDENMSMTATDMNAVEAAPADLSKQQPIAVSYSLIEEEAKRVAKLIVTKGISGARSYSERCHKAVESNPTWEAADSCAAFDYAAAHIDEAVSAQGGWPKSGYFEFQSGNQPDDYASVGAPTYMTSDRLGKIRTAAEAAVTEAFRLEVARMRAQQPEPIPPQASPVTTVPKNATE